MQETRLGGTCIVQQEGLGREVAALAKGSGRRSVEGELML